MLQQVILVNSPKLYIPEPLLYYFSKFSLASFMRNVTSHGQPGIKSKIYPAQEPKLASHVQFFVLLLTEIHTS